MLFLRLSTQWNWAVGIKAVRTGIRYEGVDSMLRLCKVKNRDVVFNDLQIMELAALAEMNGGDE